MMQRELPLIEAVVVLRDGSLHRERVARLSMIEHVRVYGQNHSEYVARVQRIGGDGRTVVYRETGRRRPA